MSKLIPKQETFVSEYLAGKPAGEAALAAGYGNGNLKSAAVAASRMLKDDKIQGAIAKAQRKIQDRGVITLEGHIKKLSELRDGAIKSGQLPAAIRAEELIGRVSGLHIERQIIERVNKHSDLSNVSEEELMERVITLGKELGEHLPDELKPLHAKLEAEYKKRTRH